MGALSGPKLNGGVDGSGAAGAAFWPGTVPPRRHWLPVGLKLVVLLLEAACAAGLARVAWQHRLPPVPAMRHSPLPHAEQVGGETVVRMPNGLLYGRVFVSADELSAYLRWEYLHGVAGLQGHPIVLTTREAADGPVYEVYAGMENDLLAGGRRLDELQAAGFVSHIELTSPARSLAAQWEQQTRLFDAAYHAPVDEGLRNLPRHALRASLARFILFKARTDRRVRHGTVPESGRVPDAKDADETAADMIAVADFYDLPLDMLLGIGAMENNYLHVRGDLKHATWKRHAQPGDLVIRRKGRRVLVSNFAMGSWQITRETLRFAHSLYLKDSRDYSKLPERMRPQRQLDFEKVDSHVLTTYAGLLLRWLLDYFHGDVQQAEGAYNGGAGNPNASYAAGVDKVASYAHRVLAAAATRHAAAVQVGVDAPDAGPTDGAAAPATPE